MLDFHPHNRVLFFLSGKLSTKTFTFGMTAYEQIWPVAEDHYGIITSVQAKAMGISRQNMVAMAESGRLERVGHGVYQVKHHVPGLNDVYALSVAIAGEDAYLRGASVLYMLGLTPANPSVMYLGTPRRIRRRFPKGVNLWSSRDLRESLASLFRRRFKPHVMRAPWKRTELPTPPLPQTRKGS